MCKCQAKDKDGNSICNSETFGNSDKCILHCEKEDISWELSNRSSEDKYNCFWDTLNNMLMSQEELKKQTNASIVKSLLPDNKLIINKVIFPSISPHTYFWDMTNKPLLRVNKKEYELLFKDCIFSGIFIFDNFNLKNVTFTFNSCKFLSSLLFISNEIKYDKKFVIEDCEFFKEVKLSNIKFNKDIFLSGNKFYDDVFFVNTKFEENLEISYCEFFKEVKFSKTFLNKHGTFQNTKFHTQLILDYMNINGKINFFNIKLNKLTRESARIIKNSFEQQNNIIEANKFYALEMKEREKELNWKKDFLDWIVFKFHGLSSNHSQSWLLALFWILNLGFATGIVCDSFLMYGYSFISFIPFLFIILMSLVIASLDVALKNLILVGFSIISYGLYSLITYDFNLYILSNRINPFSIMTGKESLTFGTLIFKVIIAYLIYQFIISIRQNTRRK